MPAFATGILVGVPDTLPCLGVGGSHRLNTTPRKCLGFRTPAEVFESKMMEIQNRLQ